MKFKRVGKKIFLRAIYGQNTKSGLNPFVAYVLVIFSKNYGHVRAFTGKINRYMLNPTVTSVSELHKPFTGKRACFLWGCVIDSIVVLFFLTSVFKTGKIRYILTLEIEFGLTPTVHLARASFLPVMPVNCT